MSILSYVNIDFLALKNAIDYKVAGGYVIYDQSSSLEFVLAQNLESEQCPRYSAHNAKIILGQT